MKNVTRAMLRNSRSNKPMKKKLLIRSCSEKKFTLSLGIFESYTDLQDTVLIRMSNNPARADPDLLAREGAERGQGQRGNHQCTADKWFFAKVEWGKQAAGARGHCYMLPPLELYAHVTHGARVLCARGWEFGCCIRGNFDGISSGLNPLFRRSANY
jgi:hypothetical protein